MNEGGTVVTWQGKLEVRVWDGAEGDGGRTSRRRKAEDSQAWLETQRRPGNSHMLKSM